MIEPVRRIGFLQIFLLYLLAFFFLNMVYVFYLKKWRFDPV